MRDKLKEEFSVLAIIGIAVFLMALVSWALGSLLSWWIALPGQIGFGAIIGYFAIVFWEKANGK